MLVNNNPTPWVVLAMIILTMCALFGGVIVWADPLGPGQPARATQAAINARATDDAIHAIQTPQAIYVRQTAIAAELTGMPPVQTATAIAVDGNLAAAQQIATQTAIANAQYLGNLSVAATATSIARQVTTEHSAGVMKTSFVVAVIVVLCLWVVERIIVRVIQARTQENFAQARMFKAKQEFNKILASHQAGYQSIPNSLMKQRGNGHERPRAE